MTETSLSYTGGFDSSRLNPNDYLNTLTSEALRVGIFTEADVDALRNDLLKALADEMGYYTKGDSSSVRQETARKLSLSLVYNIDTYLRSLGSDAKALETVKERKMSELYGKGYLINSKLFEKAKYLYGKVRFTRLKDGSEAYNRTLDRYYYNYLRDYDPRFSAQDKIYLTLPKYGIDGAFHIDGAVEMLRKLLEINEGPKADVTVSPAE